MINIEEIQKMITQYIHEHIELQNHPEISNILLKIAIQDLYRRDGD